MGQQQSKDELLYQRVNYGNIEGIKALCREGASPEWIDKEGKNPLIVACMNPELISVAKTLLELGANVNAFRPECHAGTPLHHAAKRGLEQTVNLLLSHGANAFLVNDDCQTPLDVTRMKEPYQLFFRMVEGDSWTRFLGSFRSSVVVQKSVIHPPEPANTHSPMILASAPPITTKDTGVGISSNESIQSVVEERPPSTPNTYQRPGVSNSNQLENSIGNSNYSGWGTGAPTPSSSGSYSGWSDKPAKEAYQGWGVSEAGPSSSATQMMTQENAETASIPSAPPLPDSADVDYSIHYPSIDCSPVDILIPTGESGQGGTSEAKDGDDFIMCDMFGCAY